MGGPTQSQLSRPMSSGHHISKEHRPRRKQLNSDTSVSNKTFLKDFPKGTKVETSRWCDDLMPRDGDETSVRSRVVVQQCNVVKRGEVHQGTPPLKVLRMLLALATRKDAHRRKVCGIWDVSVALFHSPMDEYTMRPPPVLRVKGKLWVLNRALYGTRMARRCLGKLVAEVLTDARFEPVSNVPNTYHHPQRDASTCLWMLTLQPERPL